MRWLASAALTVLCASAESLPVDTGATGWANWSPRTGIAARTYVDALRSRNGRGSLAVAGAGNLAVFGGWERSVPGIEAGKWYRFRAFYQAEGVDYAPRQIVARLDWTDATGNRKGQPDYPWAESEDGDWRALTLDAPAPPGAAAVKIQLLLLNAPRATVWWNQVSLEPIAPPQPRKVTVASVNLYPRKDADPVASFLAVLDKGLAANTDIALLPEGITVVGTGKHYADVAEPVPGPTTARLGEFARRKRIWLVAGLYEREGNAVYNTAVLIDREGRLAGRYRKVYIPREELEGGITPGSDYPVFRTDFGTIGLMICWDVQFSDPARALTLRGAEMILMPIWGGNETLAKSRAIENHVFLIASGYDHPTYVMDPNGEILSRAAARGALASATVDLNRRYTDPWLGDTRARFMKELRMDVPVDAPARR